jgi:23S rRNA (pseudouridine1915-N3)-methyltransferase
MKLRILAIGTRAPQWVRDGFDEYRKRLPRELSLELVELPAGKHHGDARKFKQDEGQAMLAKIRADDWVVALDEAGNQRTTTALAERLAEWQMQGRDVVFAVGGSDGLGEAVCDRSDETISLSALTYPHYMVRVILAEALYRAWSVRSGHPYHRG